MKSDEKMKIDKEREEIRDIIINGLINEVTGRLYDEDEYTREPEEMNPKSQFIAGILYPQDTIIDGEESEDMNIINSSKDEPNEEENKYNYKKRYQPSSMGINFVISSDNLSKLVFYFEGAVYHQIMEETEELNNKYYQIPFELKYNFSDFLLEDKTIIEKVIMTEYTNKFVKYRINKDIDIFSLVKLESRILIHKSNKKLLITLSISNINSDEPKHIIFHSKMSLKSEKEIFEDRRLWYEDEYQDQTEKTFSFLIRNIKEYAIGKSTSVFWEYKNEKIKELYSSFTPEVELPSVEIKNFEMISKIDLLDMEKLTDIGNIKLLHDFFQDYNSWYNKLQAQKFDNKYKKTVELLLSDIKYAQNRINEGINNIINDETLLQSFILMNETMLLTRKRINLDINPTWRPFQLAFILYSIRGVIDRDHEDRNIVDLLWFPTGGGKTEAYLGLMLVLVVYRRLSNKYNPIKGIGTAVISRYTLRLLSLQQFKRTTTIICALEILRKKYRELGTTEFSVGLWVGNTTTPETVNDARRAINEDTVYSINQFINCPWCNKELDQDMAYIQFVDTDLDNPKVICTNNECEFKEGLPYYVTDTQIYKNTPSIVIGTVDKFARVPMVKKSRSILTGYIKQSIQHDPPDLIVQDEIHLINGPLGTMYGIYEVMVNGIISNNGKRSLPKIIASSATIKGSTEHIRTLYNRDSKVFPPSGLEIGNNYWSLHNSNNSGRKYIGIYAPGKSSKTVFNRIQAYFIAVIDNIKKQMLNNNFNTKPNNLLDPYFTIIGYFNTLNELGSAILMSQDTIIDYVRLLSNRYSIPTRDILRVEELTSRQESSIISTILHDLDKKIGENAIDILYATNMISVGVDVERLGLMHVIGQPKTTSEYIQATSRIGRKYPGIVVTQYNWARPRDLSHTERFIYYHLTMNAYVDRLSSTPFSSPVMNKSLHAVIIALIRHTNLRLSDEPAAGKLKQKDIVDVSDFVVNWIEKVEGTDKIDYKLIKDYISDIFREWFACIHKNPNIQYSKKRKGFTRLMVSLNEREKDDFFPKRTNSSLRDVGYMVNLKFRI